MDYVDQLVQQAQESFEAILPKPKTQFDPEIKQGDILPFNLLAEMTWSQVFPDASVQEERGGNG